MSRPMTYAEVSRRCARMRAEGMLPARIEMRRADMLIEVDERYRRIKEAKRTIPIADPERLNAIAADVAAACKTDVRNVFRRKARGLAGQARRAFVVAAHTLGYSYVELAAFMRKPGAHSSMQYLRTRATLDDAAIANVALMRDKQREVARRAMAAQPAQEASAV